MTEKQIFEDHMQSLEEFYPVAFESIETGSQNTGFPDVYYTTDLSNGVIEIKICNNISDDNTITVPFRKGQLSKLTRLRRISEKTFVLIYAFHNYHLTNCIKRVFNNIRELEELSCFHGRSLNKTFLEALRKLPPS